MDILAQNTHFGQNLARKFPVESPASPRWVQVDFENDWKWLEVGLGMNKVDNYYWIADLGATKWTIQPKMLILSKISPGNDPGESPVNPVKFWNSLKRLEMVCV